MSKQGRLKLTTLDMDENNLIDTLLWTFNEGICLFQVIRVVLDFWPRVTSYDHQKGVILIYNLPSF